MNQKVLIISILVFLNFSLPGQNLDEILNKCYKKHGGIEKWMSIQTVQYSYEAATREELFNPKYSLPKFKNLSFHIYKAKFDSLIYRNSVSVQENGDSISLVINDVSEWVHIKGQKPIITSNNTLERLKLETFGDPPFIATSNKKFDGITTIQGIDGDQITCYRIRLFLPKIETQQVYYINTETFVIEGRANRTEDNVTVYSDYKEVDGLLVPFRATTSKNNTITIDTKYTSYFFNTSIPKGIFNMPDNKDIIIKSSHGS